ncbi:MAG TPA: hypothetical protein VHB69_01095 [Mycobacteriales bacterium]|nr:hypothetical protein [Mycobacteriales bacterium]
MTELSYAEFGKAFVHAAVSPQRICAVIAGLTEGGVRVGPMHAGPAGMATANAVGHIGDPIVDVTGEDPLTYRLTLPAMLDVDVTAAGAKHHFDVEATVRLALTVTLLAPLSLAVVAERPTYENVDVVVHPKGIQARVLARSGMVERDLRKHIARYVRELLETEVSAFETIDLMPLVQSMAGEVTASATGGPPR